MKKKKTGNNQFLKKYNQTLILDLIRVNKSISKAELAEVTGLSPTAVGVIVSSLREEGYLVETGTGESKGGRRPIMLELKTKSFYSFGVDIDVDNINIMLIDITGEVILEKRVSNAISKSISSMDSEDNVNKMDNIEADYKKTALVIASEIKAIIQGLSIQFERVLGIGLSVPGLVDSVTKEVVLAPNLEWQNVDIRRYLEELIKVPVYVENEAMASAICENWLGLCQDVKDFVCINIKSGIGAGIFINGKLYRGASGSAGEVGHIVVDEGGPKCGCGNYGCFETLASTSHIEEKARKLIREGVVSTLNRIEVIENIDIDAIVDAAKYGDEASNTILMEAGRFMGIAISNIVNTLNPSKIVLGKDFVKYSKLVLERVKNIASAKTLKFPLASLQILTSEIGEKSSTLGAAIIPLKVLFGK